jgi:hypothetical protein
MRDKTKLFAGLNYTITSFFFIEQQLENIAVVQIQLQNKTVILRP